MDNNINADGGAVQATKWGPQVAGQPAFRFPLTPRQLLLSMFLPIILALGALFVQHSSSVPTPLQLNRLLFGPSFDIFDNVILFDAPAFQDTTTGSWTAVLPAFVSLREINLEPVAYAFTVLLSDLGIQVGDRADVLADRLEMFAAIGLSGKEVDVNVSGCAGGGEFVLGKTAGRPDVGKMLKVVQLGTCDTSAPLQAEVKVSGLDSRKFNATIFPSTPTGFGIISDIDDTVKITDVSSTGKTLEATFLQDPVPVPGMPAVYASLQSTLSNPSFFYVSGSPSQLYPFLHTFIQSTYPAGPIMLQNVTLTEIQELRNLASPDGIEAYKLAMIARIQGIYPGRSFLVIGDSTQKDPETYGVAFRQFGPGFIRCIWIRRFDGANNSDARFAAAFEGVPESRIRIYNDSDIPSLGRIDVAGGSC